VSQAQFDGDDDPEILLARLRERPQGWLPEDVAHLPEDVRARLPVWEPGDFSDRSALGAKEVMRRLARAERRPRSRTKEQTLEGVVRLYKEAVSGPNPDPAPCKPVAATLPDSCSYVRELVWEARKKGLLGEAYAARAGERSTPT
jgi:hypothetical protein